MLPNLYVRYRASPAAPWVLPPLFPRSAPLAPAGTIPLGALEFVTSPLNVTACGCAADPTSVDDHLTAICSTIPLAQLEADALLQYFLLFKTRALHEVNLPGFGPGGFVTADAMNIELTYDRSSKIIRMRLSAPLTIYP
jgi:hypothetical protein